MNAEPVTIRPISLFAAKLVRRGTLLASVGLILAGCSMFSGTNSDFPNERPAGKLPPPQARTEEGRIFGPGGLQLFGGGKQQEGQGVGLGVNGFLWRASLDTLAFLPLQSADPFGGVIISDWYAADEAPKERFKVTVYILDRRLRADGIKVAVFRQERGKNDVWADVPANPETAQRLENAILTRARQLRIDTLG